MSAERTFFVIAKDALERYSRKLQELKQDEEIKLGGGMIMDDIETNSKFALKIAKLLEMETPNVFKDNSKIICSALVMYRRELEISKAKLEEKLGHETQFKWDRLDEEIRLVTDLKRSMGCKEH